MKFFKTVMYVVFSLTFAFSFAEASGVKMAPKKSNIKAPKRAVSSIRENICGQLQMGIGTNWGIESGGTKYMIQSNEGWPTYDKDKNKCGYENPMCVCGVSSSGDNEIRTINGGVDDSQIRCGPSARCN